MKKFTGVILLITLLGCTIKEEKEVIQKPLVWEINDTITEVWGEEAYKIEIQLWEKH